MHEMGEKEFSSKEWPIPSDYISNGRHLGNFIDIGFK